MDNVKLNCPYYKVISLWQVVEVMNIVFGIYDTFHGYLKSKPRAHDFITQYRSDVICKESWFSLSGAKSGSKAILHDDDDGCYYYYVLHFQRGMLPKTVYTRIKDNLKINKTQNSIKTIKPSVGSWG